LTHYVVVRADLPRGHQAANIAHAAGESSPGNLPSGTHAVVLTTPTESALHAVAARLELGGVGFVRIIETDGPYTGQLMSLGAHPTRKEKVHRFVSSLPLLR
jgi:hypothetical protein